MTDQPHGRGRRISANLLILVSVLLIGVGVLAGWVRLQLLDTDVWVETSRETIQDPAVQEALATWVVTEAYDRVQPEGLLVDVLPDRFDALAAPASAALRQAAYDGARKAMASSQVEEAWVTVNERTHTRFVRVVEGDEPIVVETASGLRLDLRPILEEVAQRIGLSGERIDMLPATFTQLQPKRSEELKQFIDALRFLDEFAPVITIFAVLTLAGGLMLGGGYRRTLVLRWGVGLIFVGLVLGAAREAMGPYLAELFADATTWRAAMLGTWEAVSLQLELAGRATILVGLVAMTIAWLGGASRPARAVRRVSAPVARAYPGGSIAAGAFVVVIALTQLPAFASRPTSTRLILFSLGFIGVVAIVRELGRGGEEQVSAGSSGGDEPPAAGPGSLESEAAPAT